MKCPRCDQIVLTIHDVCPNCGTDLVLSRELLELRSSVRSARLNSENVTSQIRQLEERIAAIEPLIASSLMPVPAELMDDDSAVASSVSAAPPIIESTTPAPAAVPPTAHEYKAPPTVRPRSSSVLSRESELQFGQKWLLIIGIAITVLAVGYFLKYSFDKNWVGPAGRVGLAYLAGFGALGLGELFRRRGMAVFGLYLIGGSIAVFYFAGYAAFQLYHLIDQPIAFGLMVVVTCVAGVFSLVYDTKWLAVLGIVGGFMTPVILSTGVDNQVALMTYMTILTAGILAIAMFKQWQLLNYLGLVFTWLLFSAWYFKYYDEARFWTTTVYLNIFFLAYALVPFVYHFIRTTPQSVAGFALTLPNAFIAFGYSFLTIQERFRLETVAVATMAYAAIFFAMSAYLRMRRRENKGAFVLLFSMGMLFLALTVPIYFSKHWITVFWAIQGIVLLWAALRLSDVWLRAGATLLIVGAIAKLMAYDYQFLFELNIWELSIRSGYSTLLAERWMTIGVSVAALFVAGRLLKSTGHDDRDAAENLAIVFYALFGISLFVVLNVEVAAYFLEAAPRARIASISVLWAIYAAVLMLLGFARNLSVLRRVAIALFAATVIKVFVRDMADVDTPFRILSFLVVGLLLVAVSFLYHRFALRILRSPGDDAAHL